WPIHPSSRQSVPSAVTARSVSLVEPPANGIVKKSNPPNFCHVCPEKHALGSLQSIGSPRGYISGGPVLAPKVGVGIFSQSPTRAALIGAATVRERFPHKPAPQTISSRRRPVVDGASSAISRITTAIAPEITTNIGPAP